MAEEMVYLISDRTQSNRRRTQDLLPLLWYSQEAIPLLVCTTCKHNFTSFELCKPKENISCGNHSKACLVCSDIKEAVWLYLRLKGMRQEREPKPVHT